VIINASTLLGGIKHHETWRIIVGSIALALIIVAIGLTALGYKRNKVTQFPEN
jgi:glucose uptake protein GlcU